MSKARKDQIFGLLDQVWVLGHWPAVEFTTEIVRVCAPPDGLLQRLSNHILPIQQSSLVCGKCGEAAVGCPASESRSKLIGNKPGDTINGIVPAQHVSVSFVSGVLEPLVPQPLCGAAQELSSYFPRPTNHAASICHRLVFSEVSLMMGTCSAVFHGVCKKLIIRCWHREC